MEQLYRVDTYYRIFGLLIPLSSSRRLSLEELSQYLTSFYKTDFTPSMVAVIISEKYKGKIIIQSGTKKYGKRIVVKEDVNI